MKHNIRSIFLRLHTWQIILFSVLAAIVITNLVTIAVSHWVWGEVQFNLIMLGTLNAIIVPLLILPPIIRLLRRAIQLEEQNKAQQDKIVKLEKQWEVDNSLKRHAEEMSFLYRLSLSLASGKNLYDTLLALQAEIVKLIQADAFYVAIYDEKTDIVKYPIFFDKGKPLPETNRLLHEWPGLTGAVIFSGTTLYLPDMFDPDVEDIYHPHNTNNLVLHTFLGIPLSVDGHVLGMLSVQSEVVDAYTADQIQLMESVAIQAAIAINKADLHDQLKQELSERERAESQLHEREIILESITIAAEQFLKSPNWRLNINNVLERFGKTFHVTHAYLFEHTIDADNVEYSMLKYEWTAPGYISDFDNPYYQTPHSINLDEGSTDHDLRHGRIFSGNSSTFPPAEKERLLGMGVKAMVEVPLFVYGNWWGTFGVDDVENERKWSNVEVDAVKIAGEILSAAIQRQEAESAVREAERIHRQAIEAADAVPYYQDYASNTYLFMGEGIYEMTGYHAKELSPQVWLDIVEETVMLGEAAGLSASEAVQLVRQGNLKSWQCDQKIRTRDGRIRWLADRSIEIIGEDNISHGSVGILQDITQRKLIEEGLRQRETILEALTFSAEQFLKTSDWRENINLVLGRLGNALNVTHAYLFEKHKDPGGRLLLSMLYEWTAPGFASDLDDPAFQNRAIRQTGVERFYEILDSGEPLVASPSILTEAERNYLADIHVKALLEMRIVVNGEQWGTIGFDDLVYEREWTAVEVDVIKVAASVLGAAIKRQADENALQNELAEHKKTGQALAFSEEKFFQAFHSTPVWMTLEDGNGYFVEVNNSFIEAVGYSREELLGHRPSEFGLISIPEDLETLRRSLKGKGTFKDLEVRIRRRSGEIATVLMSVERIYVNDSLHMLTSVLDITAHKRAEQNYRDIFNNSIDGIFQSTEDGRFISVNPAMARIYGYDSSEDMLNSVSNISSQVYVDINQRDEVRQRLNAGEKLSGYESLEYRKDGSTFWSSMSAQAIHDEHGKLLYYEGTVEDVTPRKKAEAERESLINELAKKNIELEQFTYTVSHDLKSPLVTINGFLGYLEQDAASGNMERLKMDTQRIQEAVYKMQRLLNELLELSRIGRMMNPSQAVPFAELMGEAMDIVRGQLEERRVTIRIHPNLPVVYGDKPRLIEVLQNLLDNAAKYMGDQPHPHIEIGQRGMDVESENITLYVRDNGIGIAPEHHERIFGLFNKLDARSEGTGVGLALVKRIIEFHDGRIWVESQAGMGSTFLFTLPTKPEADSVI